MSQNQTRPTADAAAAAADAEPRPLSDLGPDPNIPADIESIADEERELAAARTVADGKATSAEREAMYADIGDGGGESGAQGGMTGREDQNPIGRHR